MYALWLCVHSERGKKKGKKLEKKESPAVIVMGVPEAYDYLIITLLCLDFYRWRSYRHCLCDCSAQQLGRQLRSAVVAAQCRMDTVSTSYCAGGGPRQPWSSGLAPVSRFQSSVPLSHSSPSLIGLLASMDVKQHKLTLCLDLINTAVLSCWPEVASVISPEKAVFYFFFFPLVKKKKRHRNVAGSFETQGKQQ